jgi:hypothetical protein
MGWNTGAYATVSGKAYVNAANYRYAWINSHWVNVANIDGIRFFTANDSNMITGSVIYIYGLTNS